MPKWRNSTRRGATRCLPEITQRYALTTGATSPAVRTAEYLLMTDVFDGDGNVIADIPISEKQLRGAGSRRPRS